MSGGPGHGAARARDGRAASAGGRRTRLARALLLAAIAVAGGAAQAAPNVAVASTEAARAPAPHGRRVVTAPGAAPAHAAPRLAAASPAAARPAGPRRPAATPAHPANLLVHTDARHRADVPASLGGPASARARAGAVGGLAFAAQPR
jgi:hypothetical protein